MDVSEQAHARIMTMWYLEQANYWLRLSVILSYNGPGMCYALYMYHDAADFAEHYAWVQL